MPIPPLRRNRRGAGGIDDGPPVRSESNMSCGWNVTDDCRGEIFAVAYGTFDTKVGNAIDFSAPMPVAELNQIVESGLADLCFPDGGHDSLVDLVPLVLPKRPGVPANLMEQYATDNTLVNLSSTLRRRKSDVVSSPISSEADGSGPPSPTKPTNSSAIQEVLDDGGVSKLSSSISAAAASASSSAPLFGLACYHLYKDAAVHRGATQRAVIIITTTPMFRALKAVMRSVVVPFLNSVNVLNKGAHEAFVGELYSSLRRAFMGVGGESVSSPPQSARGHRHFQSSSSSPAVTTTNSLLAQQQEFQNYETSLCAQRELDFSFTCRSSGAVDNDGVNTTTTTPPFQLVRRVPLMLPRPQIPPSQGLCYGASLRTLLTAFSANIPLIHLCMMCRVPVLFVGNTAEEVGEAVCASMHLVAPFVGKDVASYLPYASLEVMDKVARGHSVSCYQHSTNNNNHQDQPTTTTTTTPSTPRVVKRDALLASMVAVGATNVHVRHREVRGMVKCDLSDGSVSMCDNLDRNILGTSVGRKGLSHNRKQLKGLLADAQNAHLRECYFRSSMLRYNLAIQEEFTAKEGPFYTALAHRLNIIDVPVSSTSEQSHEHQGMQVREDDADVDGDGSYLLVGGDDDDDDDDFDFDGVQVVSKVNDNGDDTPPPTTSLGATTPQRQESELFTGGRARSVTYALRQPPAAVVALRRAAAATSSSPIRANPMQDSSPHPSPSLSPPNHHLASSNSSPPPSRPQSPLIASTTTQNYKPSGPPGGSRRGSALTSTAVPASRTTSTFASTNKSTAASNLFGVVDQQFTVLPVGSRPPHTPLLTFVLGELSSAVVNYRALCNKNESLLLQVDEWYHRLLGHLKGSSAADSADDLQLLGDELMSFSAAEDAAYGGASDESLECCASQPVRACEYQQRIDRTARLRITLDYKERAYFFIDAITRTNPRALTRKINFYVGDVFGAEIVGIDAYNLRQQVVLYHSSCSLVMYVDQIKVKTSGTVYLTRNFLLFESGRLSLRKRLEIIPYDLVRGVTRYEGGVVFGNGSVKLMVDIKPFKNNKASSSSSQQPLHQPFTAEVGGYEVFEEDEAAHDGDMDGDEHPTTEMRFDATGTAHNFAATSAAAAEQEAGSMMIANKRNLNNTTALLSFAGMDNQDVYFDMLNALNQKQARTVKLLQGAPTLHQIPGEGHALFLGAGTRLSPSGVPQHSSGAVRLLCPLWIPCSMYCVAGMEITDEAWENQRSYPLIGWSSKLLPGDPPRISDFSGIRSISIEASSPCPPGFEWSTPGWVLAASLPESDVTTDKLLATNRGSHKALPKTDSEKDWGYLYGYAATWTNSSGFRTHSYTGSAIRRRLWIRRRKLKLNPDYEREMHQRQNSLAMEQRRVSCASAGSGGVGAGVDRRGSVVSADNNSAGKLSPSLSYQSAANHNLIPSAAHLGVSSTLAATVDHKLHLSFGGRPSDSDVPYMYTGFGGSVSASPATSPRQPPQGAATSHHHSHVDPFADEEDTTQVNFMRGGRVETSISEQQQPPTPTKDDVNPSPPLPKPTPTTTKGDAAGNRRQRGMSMGVPHHMREASFGTESTDMIDELDDEGEGIGCISAPREVRDEDDIV